MINVADLAFGYVFFYLFVQRGPVKGFLCRVQTHVHSYVTIVQSFLELFPRLKWNKYTVSFKDGAILQIKLFSEWKVDLDFWSHNCLIAFDRAYTFTGAVLDPVQFLSLGESGARSSLFSFLGILIFKPSAHLP